MTLGGKKVLVTGGTGFIGGRLVEKLVLECHAKVRVLVRNLAHVACISRFSLEMINGDVTDTGTVRCAAEGCDVIFHCAYGNTGTPEQRKVVTVRGTESVAKASLAMGVSRMVHVSTVSVYGRTPDGDLDESTRRRRSGDVYSDSKLEAEQLVLGYYRQHGLPVTVIQPTIVYGPFARVWTVEPINQLKNGRIVLVNDGRGLCNAVYIDDVVNVMLLAATRNEAVGEAFLVSGEEPVTWHEFYRAYEQILNIQSTISMSAEEIKAYVKRQGKLKETIQRILQILREEPNMRHRILELPAIRRLYQLAYSILPELVWERVRKMLVSNQVRPTPTSSRESKPLYFPSESQMAFLQAKTRVRIDKAKRLLGYQPRFGFERGMALTAKWAVWANLL